MAAPGQAAAGGCSMSRLTTTLILFRGASGTHHRTVSDTPRQSVDVQLDTV